jgi:hypothetical protein
MNANEAQGLGRFVKTAIVGGLSALSLLAISSSSGWAQTVVLDDPQIFIQQSGTSPAGGEPNIISNTGAFVVGVAGSSTLQNPLLVIVGAYDAIGTPSISFSGCAIPSACAAATVGTYGLTANTGTFTASSSGSAFDQLGLSSGGSESFVNWSGADVAAGFAAPTSFSLFAFSVPTNLTSSPITIDESGAANGSFIIAYGCEDGTGSSSGCATPGNIGQTVMTNTGLVNGPHHPVPEPGTLLAFGAGLLGLVLLRRRWLGKAPNRD